MNNQQPAKRRHFSATQKLNIVKTALTSYQSRSAVAREYGVNQNQLARWIREYQNGIVWKRGVSRTQADFLPVAIQAAQLPTCTESLDLPKNIETQIASTPDPYSASSVTIRFESGHHLEIDALDHNLVLQLVRTLR